MQSALIEKRVDSDQFRADVVDHKPTLESTNLRDRRDLEQADGKSVDGAISHRYSK